MRQVFRIIIDGMNAIHSTNFLQSIQEMELYREIHNENQEIRKHPLPILMHRDNDCYMVAVFNVLLRLDTFNEFIGRIPRSEIEENSPVNILKKIKKRFLYSNGYTLSLNDLKIRLLDFLNHPEIKNLETGDSKTFLSEILKCFKKYSINREYFEFSLSNSEVLYTKSTNEEHISELYRENINILISDHLLSMDKSDCFVIKEQFCAEILSTPKIVFITNDLDSSTFPKGFIKPNLMINEKFYTLNGMICYKGNHFYAIMRDRNKKLTVQNQKSYSYSKTLEEIDTAQILIFEMYDKNLSTEKNNIDSILI